MPVCRYCREEKPEASFEVCRVVKGKEYRRRRCQQCKRAVTNLRRTRLQQWLNNYKANLRCERCGFSDWRALQFHHEEPNAKEFNVADMVHAGLCQATMQREINKCCVLCANCHLIEHYEARRREWRSTDDLHRPDTPAK